MIFQKIPVDKLLPNPKNPRIDLKPGMPEYVKLRNSIEHYDYVDPIIWNKRTGMVVCGHQRLQVLKDIARDKGTTLTEVDCVVVDMNESDQDSFMIAHNKISGEWDYESLQALMDSFDEDVKELTGFDAGELIDNTEESNLWSQDTSVKGSLADRFIVPPFSILDSRIGYWRDRNTQWKKYIHSGSGRSEALTGHLNDIIQRARGFNQNWTGTSIFDPTLCELMIQWFCPINGKVIDPFAGGSVRGIVSTMCGRGYTGIDLRKEQIDANYENFKELPFKQDLYGNKLKKPNWIVGNSLNIDKLVKDSQYDMLFTCPPYFDLEQYSDSEEDLSNLTYDEFCDAYFTIIKKAVDKLKPDAFAGIVVCAVRDEKGIYRPFVRDTIKAFEQAGCKLYNDMVLLNAVGTASVRAGRQFVNVRKVVHVHQNVLVFLKGDIRNIKNLSEVQYDLDSLEKEIEKSEQEIQ